MRDAAYRPSASWRAMPMLVSASSSARPACCTAGWTCGTHRAIAPMAATARLVSVIRIEIERDASGGRDRD
ncbi:hypothetical protein [Sandarakinorhabdus limnophila]|uniref:hypothetical protein n=1 Tax=Sandarakinorhabdus limnophila TaxID=210512 RepID=UPI0012EC82C7|nr:hypothetical protein [Sandarakinorhabdus limnophila]